MGTGVQAMMRSLAGGSEWALINSNSVIAKAYDEGIRYFDMADTYGSHAIVGRVLKNKPRDGLTLTSKVWLLPFGLPDERNLKTPTRPSTDSSRKSAQIISTWCRFIA